ncbi:MAG: Eco57I restriction-modification methylase domain-containing protein [Promethearchaeota archaeon]
MRNKPSGTIDKLYNKLWKNIILLSKSITQFKEDKNKLQVTQNLIDRLIFFFFLSPRKLFKITVDQKIWDLDEDNFQKFLVCIGKLFNDGEFLKFFNFICFDVVNQDSVVRKELKIGKSVVHIQFKVCLGKIFTPQTYEGIDERKIVIKGVKSLVLEILNEYNWNFKEKSTKKNIITPKIISHLYERFVGSLEKINRKNIDLSQIKTLKKELNFGRKELGAYYTPSNIAKYMVKNVLNEYISDQTEIHLSEISHISDTQKLKEMWTLLEELKICDIACGSGAFLITAAKELFKIYTFFFKVLNKKFSEKNEFQSLIQNIQKSPNLNYYIIKKIINNNIYGVDILKSGINAVKLQFWLMIISFINSDEIESHLINYNEINFHLSYGDSLIGEPRLSLNHILPNSIKFFDWNLEFPDVFDSTDEPGFTIIIGNPPYLGADQMKNAFAAEYITFLKEEYKEVVQKRAKIDYYFFFIQRALQLLKKNGIMSFIVPNRIISNWANNKLRNYLLTYQLKEIVSFAEDVEIFNTKSVHSAIFTSKKKVIKSKNKYKLKYIRNSDSIVNITPLEIDQGICNHFNIILDRITHEQIEILYYLTSLPLLEEFMKIREGVRGIYLSNQKYMKLDEDLKNEYLKEIRGRNIRKYYIEGFNGYILVPTFKRERLTNKIRQFQPKIIFPELRENLEASFDYHGLIGVGGVYFISFNEIKNVTPKLILLILNSKLMNWLYKIIYGATAWNKSQKFRTEYLYKMPMANTEPMMIIDFLCDYITFLSSIKEIRISEEALINYIQDEIIDFIIIELYFQYILELDGYNNLLREIIQKFLVDISLIKNPNDKLDIIKKSIGKIKESMEFNIIKEKIKNHPWISLILTD